MKVKIIALLLTAAHCAYGALAIDVATGGCDNSTTVSVSATVTPGAYVVVGITPGYSGTISSIDCTGATCSFTQKSDWVSGPPGRTYSMANAPSGITAIVATFSATALHCLVVSSFTGAATASAEDSSPVTITDSAASDVVTDSIVTTCADTALVAIYNIADVPTVGVPSSGWIDIGGANGYSGGHHKVAGSYRIVSSASTYTDTRTLSAAKDYHSTAWAIKADTCTPAARRKVFLVQ